MKNERGFSLIELLIVVAVIGIIAAIAVPNLVQSKKAANEASAISSVRNIVTAQITYASTVGAGAFAGDCGTLAAAEFIDQVLGAGFKDGYNFVCTANGSDSFTVTASPASANGGTRGFYSDETGVIRYDPNGNANAGSLPLGQ